MTTLHLLIVEDSASDAELAVRHIERAGHTVRWERVATAAALRAALARGGWDALLCDFNLPELGGLEALAIVHETDGDLPFIFVSGAMGEDVAVAAMKAGAHDYVMKDNLRRLVPALERELREAVERQKRHQAETALRRLATAVAQAAETIVITDAQGTMQYVNPAFERVTGYTAAEALGQNPRLLKSGLHEPKFYEQLWQTITAGKVWSGHFIDRRKNGTLYEEEATISPVRDEAGQIAHFIAVKQDVTERQRAEAALRASERNFREIFNATSDAIFVHDVKTGRFIDVNDTMLAMYGFASKAEALRATIADISHNEPPYSVAEAEQHAQKVLREGQHTFEWQARKKNGERFWVEVSVSRSQIGGEDRLLAAVRDTTARKRAEEGLRSQLAELQRWQDVMLDREEHVQELKREVNGLCRRLGEAPRYPSQEPGPERTNL